MLKLKKKKYKKKKKKKKHNKKKNTMKNLSGTLVRLTFNDMSIEEVFSQLLYSLFI